METTKDGFEAPTDPETPVDYFVIGTRMCDWYVSRDMAQFVEARLDELPAPAWIRFVDLTGARVRVRVGLVKYVCQCSADQRSLGRAFHRARCREERPSGTGMRTSDARFLELRAPLVRRLLLFVSQQSERLHRAGQPIGGLRELIRRRRDLLRRGTLLFS